MKVELPLPSVIEAHAIEAGARMARSRSRDVWAGPEYDAMAAEKDRLIDLCFASRRQYARAVELEAAGKLTADMAIPAFWRLVEEADA